MNLLKRYIPKYSGHVESIKYLPELGEIILVFFDWPEQFKPVLKMTFTGVTEYCEEKLDDEPAGNYIELVIGLDEVNGRYCLHTDLREITFKAVAVSSVNLNS